MSILEDKAAELLQKLDTLATQYAPDVVDAAFRAITITSANNLVTGAVSVIVGAVIVWGTYKWWGFTSKKYEEEGPYSEWDIGRYLGAMIGAIASVILLGVGTARLVDIWNCVALFDPKLALAHRILGL